MRIPPSRIPPREQYLPIVVLAGSLGVAGVLLVLLYAYQASQGGDAERAGGILGALVVGAVVAIAIAVAALLSLLTLTRLAFGSAWRTARRLQERSPNAVVFVVSAPAHQGREWPDYLNGPEMPRGFATAFSADVDGLRWWRGRSLESPLGVIPAARVVSVESVLEGDEILPQLVVTLSSPEATLRLTLVGEGWSGFRPRPPTEFESLPQRIDAVLRGQDA